MAYCYAAFMCLFGFFRLNAWPHKSDGISDGGDGERSLVNIEVLQLRAIRQKIHCPIGCVRKKCMLLPADSCPTPLESTLLFSFARFGLRL